MNNRCLRLVFSKLRGMLIAVAETANAHGNAGRGESGPSVALPSFTLFAMRHTAFAALILAGFAPAFSNAQIVPSGAHAPDVIGTANGLPQVNITKPSGAGVSLNTYSQFDVSSGGAILNNSPVNTHTELAGQISGNKNFGANDAAKLIVNQVNSNNPSLLRGYVEVAGQKAGVVLSNSSGIVVDGGGFINTTRGILTTGNPLIDANGNLTGFDVTGGTITVQGAEFNASNIDQVDLIARAVKANAAIRANTLNVVAGANHVDYATLKATPIAGNGAAPGVSIDVAQLGGMYANRIVLVGNEYGVGVANAGTIAAQAGDLTLTTSGQLVQSARMTASGNLAIDAASVANSGTVYAQQSTSIATAGALANSGTLAAQQHTSISAGSVASTGVLGAGIDSDGALVGNGDLSVTSAGTLSASGHNAGAGNVTLYGVALDLANAQTWAGSALALSASGGNLSLVNAMTGAGSSITANAAGTLDNSGGTLNAPQLAIHAANLTNRGGTVTQTGTGPINVAVSGTVDNTSGTLQTNSADLALTSAAILNDNGTISNSGTGILSVQTGSLSNDGGTLATNGALEVQAEAVSNRSGTLAGQSSADFAVGSLDNGAGGQISARNVSIADRGRFSNAGGTVQADGTLGVSAQTVVNDGGSISNAGPGATTVNAAAALTNTAGGVIGGNGDVAVSGGSIDNGGGSVVASGALTAQSGGTLNNAAGLIQSNGSASVSAQGALTNVGGQIGTNGGTATLKISGASLDNSSGRIANIGTGATTVNAGAITNSNAGGVAGAGVIGGNGDVTLAGASLSNTQGGQIIAGHDLTLDESQSVDNSGGTLSAANDLTLDGAGAAVSNVNGSIHGNGVVSLDSASLDNTSGKIGNDQRSGGGIAITTGTLANQNGAIGSDRNLTLTTNQLTGDGTIVAGVDGAVTVNGDYTNHAANQIQANRNLDFTVVGNLTNQGTLGAVNALTVNAANIDNQAGADLNSSSTTVNAANAITNEGRIEGDTVATNSATLTNTATLIGDTVTLNGSQSIVNSGAAAIIAAASEVNLYSRGDISNTGGANIFSLGDIHIAADATRDANGLLANRSRSVTNDQSTIEAQGNIEVATQTLTNSRPAPTVENVTTDVESVHQTKRSKYMACTPSNGNGNAGCGDSVWSGPYKTPLTAIYAASDVVSETSGPNATDRALVVNANGVQQTIWYNTSTKNPDGSVTVTYWDGYDPNINYDPATEYAVRSDGHNGYQRVEIARDTTTTTQEDQVTGPQAKQAQLLAGGNLVLANVGTLNNLNSAIAAGGSIQIGSTAQTGSLDPAGSGNYGGTQVNNVGQTLYQYQRQDIVSTYAWNENITRDVGQVTQPSIVLTPVAIGGTGGTIIANDAVVISGTDINNTNVAAANSSTGATGGTLGANQALMGQKANAPQTVADSAGSLHITLPTSGLYSLNTAPNASYLVETDPRFTSYTQFISSDYMLDQLGLNPQSVEKRVGDGLYESQLVRNQITQLTGRVYLQGYSSNLDEYTALMTAGVNVAQQFGLAVGIALTAAEMDALTSDIVWLVSQTVTLPDGTTQSVLVPQVYLAQTHANDLQATGALIAADDLQLHATGSVSNSGTIKGGTQTVVSATDILNRGGAIGSSGSDGTTVVSATDDVVNASGLISGNRVAVLAGNNILNTTLVDATGVSSAAGDSKANTTLLGAQGTIASTGDMVIAAGNDLTVRGANISAGGAAQISAGHDITVDAVQSTTSQSLAQNDQHHWEESTVINQTSAITAGGDLAIQSGNDATFKGATVTAGGDMAVVAGGDLTATTVTDTAKYDNVATDGSSRKEVDHTYDEQAVGTTFTAGGNATLGAVSADAGKGNVTLSGSTLSAGTGAATIAASGDVTLNEAREEHDSYQAVQSKRGSFVSGSTTDTMQATQANIGVASTVSGDSVTVQAGRDLTVQGSNVVGTNDVKLGATGNVNITASQDTQQSQSSYQKKEYGFLSGLNLLNQLDGGLQGYTIGTRTTTDAQQAAQTTNNGSVIGSLNGNLTVTAGNDVHVTGSTLHAANDLNLAGKTVTIDAAYDTATQNQQQSFKQTAISGGVSNPVIAAVQTANQMRKDVKKTDGDARLTALAAATTGLAAKNAYDAVMSDPTSVGGVGINVSLGTSHSNSSSTASSSTAVGSTVSAGHNLNIAAAGEGADSNINVIGSDLSAGNNATLDAEGAINLQAAQNTDSQQSTNSGSSASIGVTFGVGKSNGISFNAGVSGTKGNDNGGDTTWTNTHVNAENMLTLQSGGDTNLKGAVADGQQVIASVGGNLNIESLQDTSTYNSKQQSGGVSVNVCVPPLCYGASSVAGNIGQQKLNSNYASVTEQSGIGAGDGGFQIDVKGNTDLKGGVISSSDAAVQSGVNSLTTATLTHSDIENRAEYSGQSLGISGGFGGEIGKSQSGTADNVNPVPGTTLPKNGGGPSGLTMAPPIAMSASGDASGTTKSAISGGTITITDGAKQQQLTGQTAEEAVASINRDTSDTLGSVAPIFDKDKIEAGFDITSQFINQVGTFVGNRAKEADAAKAAANDPKLTPEQRAQAQQLADQLNAEWGPSGTYRQVLTALSVAAGGNVTGSVGQFAQSATVAYLQELGASGVKGIADYLDKDSTAAGETARAALHAIVGCAGAAASSQSCGAGAMGAAASSVLGSLLSSTEGMSAEDREARENLVTSLVAGIAAVSGANAATASGAAQIEVENNQVSILAPTKNPLTTDLVKTFCSTGNCTDEQVSQLLQAQNQINEAAGKNAVTAAAAAAIVVAVPALAVLGPEALALALSNPAAAVNAGIITAETAAAIATNSVTPGVVVEGVGAKASGELATKIDVEIAAGKFEYLFGNVTSSTHNAARSNQLALEMKRLGVSDTPEGHAMISEYLKNVVNTDGNISRTFSSQYGNFEVRDSLFIGPSGQAVKLESTFLVNADGTRRLSTIIPFQTGK
ncbi:hemagglutinin repeat-containing protein [Paraburkholderia sp. MMS20-SJTR3]|uniref:Hemagglutinin repeat-containing protein n=1 Tax=Paraburkholderia sejongensis TaxID=2886946 RepID=A0ABS8K0Z6_9BURK|nr:hemagglutinin repeat-containing protein [Paraburkholderia sp. MMS20-SJTR3]MCC8395608.1 hemagglutinin repeat-containing protein [Paraburkholderia sp. MMS20-SJTR3]